MMTINRAMALATILAVLPAPLTWTAVALDDDAKPGIDGEGYIGTWLVLAPIPMEKDQEGAEALGKEQVKDEASLKPKAGDKVEVDGKELTWKSAEAKEGILNFNDVLGEVTPNSVAYAVSTLIVEDDKSDVTLKVGSDDQIRIFLNGKQIHSTDEGRSLEKDQDTIEGLTLNKGRNVLVIKVVNEPDDWLSSVRVLDKDGAPIKGITATTKPE